MWRTTSKLIIWCTCTVVMLWVLREKWCDTYHMRKVRHSSKNLNVLTFNIQRMPYSMKPLSLLHRLISTHSIILLQECFLNVLYDDIQYEFPEYHIIKGTMNGYRLVNSGLVILTKYPIVSHTFIPFEDKTLTTSDALAEKGFLVAQLRIKDKLVYIINTHLQSSNYRNDDTMSIKQWRQLYEYVSTLKYPWLLGGDFNININKFPSIPYSMYSSFYPTLYIKYKDDYEVDTSCTPKDGYDPYVFDFFISNDIELDTPDVLPLTYSDHLPVSTRINRIT